MIQSKKDLIEYLKYEKKLYLEDSFEKRCRQYISKNYNMYLWKYVKELRKTEYYFNCTKGIKRVIMYTIHRRIKAKLGLKLGIQMYINNFDKGLKIAHPFSIIINKKAKIGSNCTIRGNVCIGNDGFDNENIPVIGNNVNIGWGAIIYGKISIGDNCIIGANSTVNKSFENNSIIVGSPARTINRKDKLNENSN